MWKRPRRPKRQSCNAVAIRSFRPVYCNTCIHFDLEKAAQAGGRLFCPYREEMHSWDDRACVLYTPVSDGQRQARSLIVVQLHEDKKRREGAEAKDAAEGGQ